MFKTRELPLKLKTEKTTHAFFFVEST